MTDHRRAIVPQLVIGFVIIIAGILFTLENVGVLDAQEYIRYWPAGLIAVGLVKLWQGRGGATGGFPQSRPGSKRARGGTQ